MNEKSTIIIGAGIAGLSAGCYGQMNIDENAEDLDHLITPEERYKVAMSRQ